VSAENGTYPTPHSSPPHVLSSFVLEGGGPSSCHPNIRFDRGIIIYGWAEVSISKGEVTRLELSDLGLNLDLSIQPLGID
jgi:hypothetical protein